MTTTPPNPPGDNSDKETIAFSWTPGATRVVWAIIALLLIAAGLFGPDVVNFLKATNTSSLRVPVSVLLSYGTIWAGISL